MNHSQPGVSARETKNGTQEYAVGSFRFGNDTHPAARQEQLPCLTPPFLDRCNVVSFCNSLQHRLMHRRFDAARNLFSLNPHRLVAATRPEINNQGQIS